MFKKLKKFFNETTGSIVPTMGILLIPMTIVIGAAIDYTRYVNMKNEIQNGVDAAGIAATVELSAIQTKALGLEGDAYNKFIEDELTAYADRFLKANITSEPAASSYTFDLNFIPPTNEDGGKVALVATSTYDTIFGGVNGQDGGALLFKDEIVNSIESLITTGNRSVEIALVMDNSGSMAFEAGNLNSQRVPAPENDRRITLLQEAANDLITDLQQAVANAVIDSPLQFSVVPFSSSVNVGNIDHDNHNDDFLDVSGFASYHNENLDWTTYVPEPNESVITRNNNRSAVLQEDNGNERFLTRLDIFPMLNTQWEGCVEMRPYPHNIEDTFRDSDSAFSNTASDALFVPYMVPDEPDEEYFRFYSDAFDRFETTEDRRNGNEDDYTNNYIPDFYTYNPIRRLAEPRFINDNLFTTDRIDNGDINNNQITRTNWVSKYQAFTGLDENRINSIDPSDSRRERQLKDILRNIDIPTFEKDLSQTGRSYFNDSGPNAFCPDVPVLQLTDDFQEVRDAIDAMEAHGGTNIQQGLTWGWRTLSRGLPFTSGRPNSDVENRKILILLTDGNNFYAGQNSPNNSGYGAWGYQRTRGFSAHALNGQETHGRLLEGTDSADRKDTIYENQFSLPVPARDSGDYSELMNLHTNQACNNIKNDGISIYSIAFDVPTNGRVRNLLENCSGSGRQLVDGDYKDIVAGLTFYHDVQGLQLKATFEEIASSITAIRIAE